MIVTQDVTKSKVLAIGIEVIQINQTASASILRGLVLLARAHDAKRIDQLSVTGDSRYESFDINFPLVFAVPGST